MSEKRKDIIMRMIATVRPFLNLTVVCFIESLPFLMWQGRPALESRAGCGRHRQRCDQSDQHHDRTVISDFVFHRSSPPIVGVASVSFTPGFSQATVPS